jgi:hypothetical protein
LEKPFFKLNLRQVGQRQEGQLPEGPQPEEPQPEEPQSVEFQQGPCPKVLGKKQSWMRNLGQLRLKLMRAAKMMRQIVGCDFAQFR